MSTLLRCLTVDGAVMALAADTTDMAARAEQIHKTSAVVTAALGRCLTAASLMGIQLKGADDSVTLRIKCDGSIGGITAVSDSAGNVRGYAVNPVVELPLKPNGKLDVGGAVGGGMLYIIRDTGGVEPYVGCTPLISGEIAEDVTHYYAVSEQIPTVCSLGVLVNPDLTVKAAGGLLIQLLPGCPEETITQLEANVAALPSMTSMLEAGLTPADIAARALEGFPFEILETAHPAYHCPCSRERVKRALAALPPADRAALPDENGEAEVTCQFCDRVYHIKM